jgi:hypothetical protein
MAQARPPHFQGPWQRPSRVLPPHPILYMNKEDQD